MVYQGLNIVAQVLGTLVSLLCGVCVSQLVFRFCSCVEMYVMKVASTFTM